MPKITFMGAGSTVFAKNVLNDCMLSEALHDADIALYDIDGARLRDSKRMISNMNKSSNKGRAKIKAYHGVKERKAALRDANYVVNAIQVGGYDPCTITDFEIPKKYGLRQTIADTLGIGGLFRSLRTIPVMMDFARDMEKVCPDAWFLNYSNPMSVLTGAMLRGSDIKSVGLCHSVQGCANWLLRHMDMKDDVKDLQWKIAGINHMSWLLEITDGGKDLYPEIKKRARAHLKEKRKKGAKKGCDMVRLELMLKLGYYITESSEHNAEYTPWWIKSNYPELIEEFNIPLDEYPRRCVGQIASWKKLRKELLANTKLKQGRTREYGSYIMEAMETGVPISIGGNVMNNGSIPNLPSEAVVEIPCMVDRSGVQPTNVGRLPEICAAVNRTNINVHLLTLEAAFTRKKEAIYHAAMMDPHTAAELSIDDIVKMCNELIKAHGDWMPKYR